MEEYDNFSKIPDDFTGTCRITNAGIDNGIHHYRNRLLHNEKGPCSLYNDGAVGYKINDKWHRLGGPAFYVPEDSMAEDTGVKQYWVRGVEYTEQDYYKVPEVIKILLKNVLKL